MSIVSQSLFCFPPQIVKQKCSFPLELENLCSDRWICIKILLRPTIMMHNSSSLSVRLLLCSLSPPSAPCPAFLLPSPSGSLRTRLCLLVPSRHYIVQITDLPGPCFQGIKLTAVGPHDYDSTTLNRCPHLGTIFNFNTSLLGVIFKVQMSHLD